MPDLMFGFTRREQQFILFLLIALSAGFFITKVRNQNLTKPDITWQVEKQQIIQEFQAKARDGVKSQSVTEQPCIDTKRHKQALIGQININTASSSELQLLDRIGPVTAKKILDYRSQNGPFESTDELKNIKGIGPVTYDTIKSQICIK